MTLGSLKAATTGVAPAGAQAPEKASQIEVIAGFGARL
jgi:hypothetical protein